MIDITAESQKKANFSFTVIINFQKKQEVKVSVFAMIKNFQNKTGKSEFWLSFNTFLITKEQEKASFNFHSLFF